MVLQYVLRIHVLRALCFEGCMFSGSMFSELYIYFSALCSQGPMFQDLMSPEPCVLGFYILKALFSKGIIF